jgi:hypothetical protein
MFESRGEEPKHNLHSFDDQKVRQENRQLLDDH